MDDDKDDYDQSAIPTSNKKGEIELIVSDFSSEIA